MTIPVWVLLAFAMWTLLILASTVGVYRWSRVLTGRDRISTYSMPRMEGEDWYKRAMRAHANCVENLPVYGGIVVVIAVGGVESTSLDVLALILMGARVLHTLVHVGFVQTDRVTLCRSMLFNTQWIAMIAMGVITALALA